MPSSSGSEIAPFWQPPAYGPGAVRIRTMSIQRSSNGAMAALSLFNPYRRSPPNSGGISGSASGRSSRLAQGVSLDNVTATNPSSSMIFEWDGNAFRHFQSIPSAWGYNWRHFSISGGQFLAYADHMLPSTILRWNGAAFEPFQTLEGKGGRAFLFFQDKSEAFLAFARITRRHAPLPLEWNDLCRAPDPERSGRPRVCLSGAQR